MIAHVRGGGEFGEAWHQAGATRHKLNSIHDLIDCLVTVRTELFPEAADAVFLVGASAGGLIAAAVANLAPGLCRGICLRVPFVDIVTTMLDPSIPLTTHEYTEWGNPALAEDYEYMLSYSPYDNIVAQDYPAMYVTAGLWDSQVQYWEPAKYVARLRRLKTDRNPLLLSVDMEAGHVGASGWRHRKRDTAAMFAFFLACLEPPDAARPAEPGVPPSTP